MQKTSNANACQTPVVQQQHLNALCLPSYFNIV